MRVIGIEPSGSGGIGHYSHALFQALAKQGIDCDILTSKRWQYPIDDGSALIHRIFDRKHTNPFRVYSVCRSLGKKADIVHWQSASHPKLLLWLTRLIPLARLPWVYTVHNVLPHENSLDALPLHRALYRRMQGLIFHNQYSYDLFQEHFPNHPARKRIIPFGDFGHVAGSQDLSQSMPETPTILFFGNIRPYKGLMLLLRAFQMVRNAIPQARLRITGQDLEPFDPYRDFIESQGLASSVDIELGYIVDQRIPDIFSQASIVALPYVHIDQSAVLFLALGLGKAVAATRVGGIPEVIRDGETGILVPPGDPDAFAQALIDGLQSRERLMEIGRRAALDVRERFSWDAIAGQTIEFYREVMSS